MLITRLLGIFAFACAAALLGCSSGSEPTAAESEALVCGTRTAITVDGEAVQVPAWVNARGINAKLRFYPGLAGLLGRDRIETCDDARAYEAAYEQYASQYPGFDDDEPYETRPVPPLPADARPNTQSEKIAFGDIGPFSPVVNLYTKIKGKYYSCTGTFIAKNWIMTAAHCMNIGEKAQIQPDNAYYTWWVVWGDANGHQGKTQEFPYVLQVVHPSYSGTFGDDSTPAGTGAIGRDFALLYFDGIYDGDLPASNQPDLDFMRLSDAGSASSSARAWGWGAPNPPARVGDLLRSAPVSGFAPVFPSQNDDTALIGQTPSTPPLMCRGDSGGPLVDKYFVTDPANSNQTIEVPAAVATLSGGTFLTKTSVCLDSPGGLVIWGRTDKNFRFLRRVMQERFYGPDFYCNFRTDVVSAVRLASCWLKPCRVDADCAGQQPASSCVRVGLGTSGYECSGSVCNTTPSNGKCQPLFNPNSL